MDSKKASLFMIITLVLCVLLFLQHLTGEICHAFLGVLLIIIMVVHMCRQIAKMKYKKNSIRAVDWVLMVSMVVLFLTGMLLHPLQGMPVLKILHELAAVLFLLGIIVHIVQHRKMQTSHIMEKF